MGNHRLGTTKAWKTAHVQINALPYRAQSTRIFWQPNIPSCQEDIGSRFLIFYLCLIHSFFSRWHTFSPAIFASPLSACAQLYTPMWCTFWHALNLVCDNSSLCWAAQGMSVQNLCYRLCTNLSPAVVNNVRNCNLQLLRMGLVITSFSMDFSRGDSYVQKSPYLHSSISSVFWDLWNVLQLLRYVW